MPGGRSGAGEGVPPQFAAPVCKDLLRVGKGYRTFGGYPGPCQYRDDPDLYHGIRVYPPQAAGADAAGHIKRITTELSFRGSQLSGVCPLFIFWKKVAGKHTTANLF